MATPSCTKHPGHSANMQSGLDRFQCLNCGAEYDLQGNELPGRPQFDTPVSAHGSTQQGVRKAEY